MPALSAREVQVLLEAIASTIRVLLGLSLAIAPRATPVSRMLDSGRVRRWSRELDSAGLSTLTSDPRRLVVAARLVLRLFMRGTQAGLMATVSTTVLVSITASDSAMDSGVGDAVLVGVGAGVGAGVGVGAGDRGGAGLRGGVVTHIGG